MTIFSNSLIFWLFPHLCFMSFKPFPFLFQHSPVLHTAGICSNVQWAQQDWGADAVWRGTFAHSALPAGNRPRRPCHRGANTTSAGQTVTCGCRSGIHGCGWRCGMFEWVLLTTTLSLWPTYVWVLMFRCGTHAYTLTCMHIHAHTHNLCMHAHVNVHCFMDTMHWWWAYMRLLLYTSDCDHCVKFKSCMFCFCEALWAHFLLVKNAVEVVCF